MRSYLITVKEKEDIGINEHSRAEVVWVTPNFHTREEHFEVTLRAIEIKPATPKTKETDSAPTGKSLEERVKSLENAVLDKLHDAVQTGINTRLIDVMYETQPKANEYYNNEIASIKQQLSELQQAFVKYAICKHTELPQGGKGYIAAEPIERGKFVYTDSCGKVRECSKEHITPHGSHVQANNPKIMTIEEAERQIKLLEAHSDQLLSEPRWSLATHYTVAENVEKVCALKEWIENQKNIKPPEKPDIVEQIKAGENKLLEHWVILKNKSSTYHKRTPDEIRQIEEYESLYEHLEKLVKIHTKADSVDLVITPANLTYRILKNGIVYEYK